MNRGKKRKITRHRNSIESSSEISDEECSYIDERSNLAFKCRRSGFAPHYNSRDSSMYGNSTNVTVQRIMTSRDRDNDVIILQPVINFKVIHVERKNVAKTLLLTIKKQKQQQKYIRKKIKGHRKKIHNKYKNRISGRVMSKNSQTTSNISKRCQNRYFTRSKAANQQQNRPLIVSGNTTESYSSISQQKTCHLSNIRTSAMNNSQEHINDERNSPTSLQIRTKRHLEALKSLDIPKKLSTYDEIRSHKVSIVNKNPIRRRRSCTQASNSVNDNNITDDARRKHVIEEQRKHLIHCIVHWDTKWIETEKIKGPPKVWAKENIILTPEEMFGRKKMSAFRPEPDPKEMTMTVPAFPEVSVFDNMDNYKQHWFRFIVTELWSILSASHTQPTDWFTCDVVNRSVIDVKKHSALYTRIFDLNLKLTEETNNDVPNTGDVVIIEKRSKRFFGYVYRKEIEDVHNYNSSGKPILKTVTLKIQFTSEDSEILAHASTVQLRMLKGLRQKITKMYGLFELGQSSLMEVILKPCNKKVTMQPNEEFPIQTELINLLKINDEQERTAYSVAASLMVDETPSLNVIEGAPGTGKTQTLIAAVLLLLSKHTSFVRTHQSEEIKKTILICTNGYSAIKDVMFKLNDTIQKIHNYPGIKIKMAVLCKVEEVHQFDEILMARQSIDRTRHEEKKSIQCVKLSTNVKQVSMKIEELRNADIIFTTVDEMASEELRKSFESNTKFQILTAFIDDAQLVPEVYNLIPLMYGVRHLVLVGDLNDRHPTVSSRVAATCGLHKSLIYRVNKSAHKSKSNHNGKIGNFNFYHLKQQHRMSPTITNVINGILSISNLEFEMFQPKIDNTGEFCIYNHNYAEYNTMRPDVWMTQEISLAFRIVNVVKDERSSKKFMIVTANSHQYREAKQQLGSYLRSQPQSNQHYLVNNAESCQEEADVVLVCMGQPGPDWFKKTETPDVDDDKRKLGHIISRSKQLCILIGQMNLFQENRVMRRLHQYIGTKHNFKKTELEDGYWFSFSV